MDDFIAKELDQEKPTPFHDQILKDTLALVAQSRRKMQEFYAQWDKYDDIFRSLRRQDTEDKLAKERGEPEKMVIPSAYAQVSTFVGFCMQLYTQRDSFFELTGYTAEDEQPAKIGEALLNRDLSKNVFEAILQDFLLNIGRFGIGILKTRWSVEKQQVREVQTTPPPSVFGVVTGEPTTTEVLTWATAYEGNRISNVSPYRFYPDTRLPLTRFQEGEFCASADFYSVVALKQLQAEGVVAGVNYIGPLRKDPGQELGYRGLDDLDLGGDVTKGAGIRGDGQSKSNVVVLEVQRAIIPKDYMVEGKPLGEEDYPVKYVIWIANDNRVIKCEPMNYIHNEYTYSLAPFMVDTNTFMPLCLLDTIDKLQEVISWFINSRITNVRKVMGDKLIVNPAAVNMSDLNERRPVIRINASAVGDIDRHIKQLQLQDVTAAHINDVKVLKELMQEASGINDTLMGNIRPGKRSATENRNTTAGSSSRVKVPALIIFRTALEPMGRQMLSNLRDGLEEPTYVKLLGSAAATSPEFVQVTRQDLVGNYDFEIFDATLPSERHLDAQALEEWVAPMLQNPQIAMILGLDIRKMVFEIMRLRGIKNPDRFALPPQPQLAMQPPMAGDPNAANAGGGTTDQTNPNANANTAPGISNPNAAAATPFGPGGPTPGVPGTVQQPILPFPIGQVG